MMKLKRYLKIHRWWDSQLQLMLVLVYYSLTLAKPIPSVGKVLLTLVLFLLASIGIAGFGHLLNDLMDLKQDERSGASNLVARRKPIQIALRFGFVLLASWLPWCWLPHSRSIWALLALEYGLFVAYSMPPIRLKERGILGPSADALYGYTVPQTVSLLVFARLGHVIVPLWFYALLGAWTFVMGLRHMLLHQLDDVANDEVTGTKTFVTLRGWRAAFTLMDRTLFPLEAGGFLLFLLALGFHLPLVPVGFLVYSIWVIVKQRNGGIGKWQIPGYCLPSTDCSFSIPRS